MDVSEVQLSSHPQPEAFNNGWTARLRIFGPAAVSFIWLSFKQDWALRALSLPTWYVRWLPIAATMLLFFGWLYALRSRRARGTALLLFNFVLTFITYGDTLYYRSAHDFISVATLRFAWQLATVGDAVTALMRPSDLWMWIDIPLMVVWIWWDAKRSRADSEEDRVRPLKALSMTVAGVVVLTAVAHIDPYVVNQYYGHTMVTSHMGMGAYHMLDAVSYAGRLTSRWAPTGEAVAEVNRWLSARNAAQPPASERFGVAKGKNVILLQVESLQAFTIGLRVDGQEITPNLNRLVQRSTYFTDFYNQIGQGTTADADLLANCSLYPTATGAVYYDYANNDYRCMPTLMREHGYSAVAMQGMRPDFWNLSSVYPHIGFERFYARQDFRIDEEIGLGLSDESFLQQSVEKLKAQPEPYYAFVVTLTSHAPFDFEHLPQTLKLGALEGTKAGHYLNAIHYTDGAIGKFIDRLEAEGLLDKAVLAVYGDHQGVYRQTAGMSDLLRIPAEDEVRWMEVETRVPLIVRTPGQKEPERATHAAGEVDIAPTLAGLVGVETTTAYFMGRDLFRQPIGPVVLNSGFVMSDQFFHWIGGSSTDPGQCFSRASGQKVPPQTCGSMAHDGAKGLQIGRLIIEHNLIPKLALPQ